MEDKLIDVIVNVLHIGRENISDASGPENITSWDSFNSLILVTELEKIFNIQFSIDEVSRVKNVGDIKAVLRQHGITI